MQTTGQDSKGNGGRQAYLLRCWQEADGCWRYSVEVVDGRSLPRRGFSSRANLLAHLHTALPRNLQPDNPQP